MNNILESALKYKIMGYSVIPINPSLDEERGKKPFIAWTEFQSRIASEDEIKSWWKKWPKAMIGVVTGKISGFFGIDADTPEALTKAEELIPDTLHVPTCLTPRPGKHFYFKMPYEIRNSNDGLIHVRGEGGYVVFPPSMRENGKQYSWQVELNGQGFPDPPIALLDYIKSIALSLLYREPINARSAEVSKVSDSQQYFIEGRRDEDIFHLANDLIKCGNSEPYVIQVLEKIALSCNPPFSLNETAIKIHSAMERAKRREINIAQDLREWIEVSEGQFRVSDYQKESAIVSKTQKHTLNVAVNYLKEKGIIEKVGKERGIYRKVENKVDEINWEDCDDTIVNVKWPFDLDQYYLCLPKNIIVIAGSPDAGKTAFCLNFAMLNMEKYQIKFFSSEMGALELKVRLKKFGIPFNKWKGVKFIERSTNFADVIDPDGINVVDYIEVPEEAWKIATPINEIFRKLNKGICVIALQKPRGRDVARGGESTLDRPRLYLSMGSGQIKIVKCKNWANEDKNPNGLSLEYKIVQGCKFIQNSEWSIPWEEVRR